MSRVSMIAAVSFLTAAVAACGGEPTDLDTLSAVSVNLTIGEVDVRAVAFDVICESDVDLSGQFNVNDEHDPPIWGVIMDLPVGDCTIEVTPIDAEGEPLCTGSSDFTVVQDETVRVSLVLTCVIDPDDGSAP